MGDMDTDLFEEEDVVAQRYQERCPVDAIRPHPMNPNKGDVEFIAESIRINGFYGAVLVQEGTNYIIAGEHRWRAAIDRGRKTVPVFWKDCTEAEALRIMLVDNESARRAKYNAERMAVALASLATLEGGLDGSGFDLDDLQEHEENTGLMDPDDAPDDVGDRYGVIIECETEAEQIAVFEKLSKAGFTGLRVIAV